MVIAALAGLSSRRGIAVCLSVFLDAAQLAALYLRPAVVLAQNGGPSLTHVLKRTSLVSQAFILLAEGCATWASRLLVRVAGHLTSFLALYPVRTVLRTALDVPDDQRASGC